MLLACVLRCSDMTAGEIAEFSSMSLPVFDVLLAFILSLYCLAFSFNTYIEK